MTIRSDPKLDLLFPSPQGEMYSNRFIAGSGVHKLPSTPFCLLGQYGVLQKNFKPGQVEHLILIQQEDKPYN